MPLSVELRASAGVAGSTETQAHLRLKHHLNDVRKSKPDSMFNLQKGDRAQLVAKLQNVLPAMAMSVGAAGAFATGSKHVATHSFSKSKKKGKMKRKDKVSAVFLLFRRVRDC